jgi:gliding motility-associated lipoprotein GldH
MKWIGVVAWLALVFVSCDTDRVYEYNHEFKDRTWRSADTVAFEFRIKDIGQKYNVYYNVRNSLDYPWARLFVQYSLRDSLGATQRHALVSEFLFEKTGRPRGNTGLGDLYDHQFPLLKEYQFERPGLYVVKLAQFMRTDSLKGMLAVGVRVETAGEKK